MASKKGQKHQCVRCGTKFYDLNKIPVTCPKCGIGKNIGARLAKPRKKDLKTFLWTIFIDPHSKKPEVIAGPNTIDTSSLTEPGWYFFSPGIAAENENINPSDTIYLQEAPVEGVRSYLETYAFKGIGKETAKKLTSEQGPNVLSDLSGSAREISENYGIPLKIARSFEKAWKTKENTRLLQILLRQLGLGNAACKHVMETYGNQILERFLKDPFELVRDIPYFHFEDAQKVVNTLMLDLPRDRKIIAAMEHCLYLSEKDRGHTCAPLERAFGKVAQLIDVEDETIINSIRSSSGYFCFMENKGEEYIATLPSAEREKKISSGLYSLFSVQKSLGDKDTVRVSEFKLPGSLELSEKQKAALERAIKEPVTLITGGPGTGKTTMVIALVRALKAQGRHVTLCAPTGRAAKRLEETPGLRSFEPTTIHLLLTKLKARKHRKIDVLIIDEASMVDADLMVRILDVLGEKNSLIMIGDADQLPPVGPGQVFKDLLKMKGIPNERLVENCRQSEGSNIITAAKSVMAGRLPPYHENMFESQYEFREENDEQKLQDLVLNLYLTELPERLGLDKFNEIQVLTPQRTGLLGTRALNRKIQDNLWAGNKPLLAQENREPLFHGDKVIQTVNNYALGVMNGDIGRILDLKNKIVVDFRGKEIEFDSENSRALEPAYAITVHKSQGSEYPAVIIPTSRTHMHMLGRNLLYTAITRGKEKVLIVGNREVYRAGIGAAWKDFRYTILPLMNAHE